MCSRKSLNKLQEVVDEQKGFGLKLPLGWWWWMRGAGHKEGGEGGRLPAQEVAPADAGRQGRGCHWGMVPSSRCSGLEKAADCLGSTLQ